MSHTLTSRTVQITPKAAAVAARTLKLQVQENSEHRFFDGTVKKGTVVHLPGWNYPVVFSPDMTVHYDNYSGRWGKQVELTKLQGYGLYAMEMLKNEDPEGDIQDVLRRELRATITDGILALEPVDTLTETLIN